MKYQAMAYCNNNSTIIGPYYGNNKQLLAKEIKEICKGNTFAGNRSSWSVLFTDSQANLVNCMQSILSGQYINK